jgi:hypothetical protein
MNLITIESQISSGSHAKMSINAARARGILEIVSGRPEILGLVNRPCSTKALYNVLIQTHSISLVAESRDERVEAPEFSVPYSQKVDTKLSLTGRRPQTRSREPAVLRLNQVVAGLSRL